MDKTQQIRIEVYDYPLPDEKIAKFPLEKRDESKLLIYRSGEISETRFKQISDYLPENALMIFNNTRVIQARLIFRKETGARIEIFCLEPKEPSDYVLAFQERKCCSWLCMVGNAKKWKNGKLELISTHDMENVIPISVTAEKIESYGETALIRFEWNNDKLCFADILEQYGELPIPPYLNRKTEEKDKVTYQTIYSKINGSVAAPTAGLHFTPAVFDSLKEKNIIREEVTLHVGAGTFKPVKSETIENHEMHTELISANKKTIELLLQYTGKVYAVGTTSVRTLESLYYIGVILEKNPDPELFEISQWMPYQEENNNISTRKALENIIQYLNKKQLQTVTAHTRIMIAPGYTFKIMDGIITNFHQPKSTLLLLISAFTGENWKKIYDYALRNDFRFLSYGDSCLLVKS